MLDIVIAVPECRSQILFLKFFKRIGASVAFLMYVHVHVRVMDGYSLPCIVVRMRYRFYRLLEQEINNGTDVYNK